jgi:hypothetical protein
VSGASDPKATTVHYRKADGAAVCAKPGVILRGRVTLLLGKVNCWRCLEKVLGEPPLDAR